jgi:hypothetical protein
LLVTRYLTEARAQMSAAEIHKVQEMGEEYRSRLHDLSWLMRWENRVLHWYVRYGRGTSRSLQIRLARYSLISRCRGIVVDFPADRLT